MSHLTRLEERHKMSRTGLDTSWKTIDVPDDESPAARSMGNDLQELLTVDEVAALLKVSKSWVYEHTRRRARVDRVGWST